MSHTAPWAGRTARPIALHTVTQTNAAMVVGYFGQAPKGAGSNGSPNEDSIPEKLIELALICDDYNLERLERGFEGIVSAVRIYQELPDGLGVLRQLGYPTPF